MILVTGGTGLVGHHLLAALVASGQGPVSAICRQMPADPLPGVKWIQADITDVGSLIEAFAGVQQLYHAAALVSFAPQDAEALYLHNVIGTENVVNAALETGVHKMVYVSSVAALGRIRKDNTAVNETMQWTEETSNSTYGKTKYLAEREVWRGLAEGLDAVVVNPSIILGNADWNKGSAKIFKSAWEEFGWYTTGTSGFVDVADLVTVMQLLMNSSISGERFIVSGHALSYEQLFRLAADAFGKRRPHKKVTPLLAGLIWRWEALKAMVTGQRPLITRETAHTSLSHIAYDVSKLRAALPSFAFTPIETSVRRIAAELRQRYGL